MADVITRFKLETTQYDSALRDASKGLAAYSKQAELAGKDFDKFTKGGVEAARALGNISTSATNTKEKVKELVSAYNDVARAYNNLTEEQKKSDFGKAMAQSLQQLQGRIKDAKAEMNDTGGVLSQLRERFTVNIDALKLFSVGLQAAQGALSVAKDAFFASEQNVDEWASVVAASESVYEGFLTAINNGDISGYLGRIDQIVQAAREAYNELDKLGTMRTIQGPQFSKQEAENTRMRMMIMTGRYIAPAAGSGMKAAMAEGTMLTPEQIRRIEQKLENGMKSIGALTKNELAQTGKAIDAYYNKLAVQNGMSRSEFRQGTSSWDEFSRRMQGYEQYKEWDRQARTEFAKQGGRGYVDFDKSNPYAEYRKWGTFRVDKMGENSFNDLVGLIKQQQQQTNQLYSQMGQTYRTINRAEGVTVKGIMNGKGGSGGGKGGGNEITYAADSIAAQSKLVQDLTKQWNEAGDDVRTGYLYQLIQAENKLKEMKDEQKGIREQEGARASMTTITDTMGTDLSDVLGISATIEHIQEELDKNPIVVHVEKSTKDIKAITQAAQTTAEVVGSIGNAFNAIEDPAAKVAGTVAQAIATIAAGYATATTQAASMGPWAWVAFAATGLAQMFTMINAVHSATGYAEGGIVKGNSYSGDNVPALVDGSQMVGLNAGEVVLTAAQTNNLAAGIQNGGSRIQVVGKLSGEQLFICAERWAKRTGKGEFVTWR